MSCLIQKLMSFANFSLYKRGRLDDSTKIQKICYETEDMHARIKLIEEISSSAKLYELLDHYNWNDGFVIPTAIADHPLCDLAIAQRLYWLASADDWYESNIEVTNYNSSHYDFSKLISERLLSDYYKKSGLTHTENFTKVQLYKFRKKGLPGVFYEPVGK